MRIFFSYMFLLLMVFDGYIFSLSSHADMSISGYFDQLYKRHSAFYADTRQPVFKKFCTDLELNIENEQNKNLFYRMYFFHDLLTGSACIDFVSGGILKLPYAWHWVRPNPRHTITYKSSNVPLVKVLPPKAFNRYKSYADIDRVPSLYLKDLFSENPKYFHPIVGEFYSFGWCSEREMAYAALMDIFGYACKIKQEGIHVRTGVWLPMAAGNGRRVSVVIEVDNSVDVVAWKRTVKEQSYKTWKSDIGKGTQVAWYNRVAFSDREKRFLNETMVTEKQTQWIERRVNTWLDNP